MKKILAIMTAITLSVLLLTACGGSSDQSNKGYTTNIIRVNQSGNYASSVQQIIMLKGLLEPYLPEDVSVQWTNLTNSTDSRDAVVSGRTDIVSIAVPTFITAVENEMPLALISATSGAPAYLYSNNSEITKLEDIADSTRISIASKASASIVAFFIRCKDTFGDASIYDSNIVTIPNEEALATLATSRELDGALLTFPSTIRADEIENLILIEDLTPTILAYNLTSYFATNEEFYKNNPVLVEAFRKASCDAVNFINDQTLEAAILLAELYGIEYSHVEKAIAICPPSLEVSNYDLIAELMYESDMLPKEPMKFKYLPNYNDIPQKTE